MGARSEVAIQGKLCDGNLNRLQPIEENKPLIAAVFLFQ